MQQRIEALSTEKGLSRPALAAALGLPKGSVDKFETGRQTPTKEQQEKMASFFAVSLFYLRGESNDRTKMEHWADMDPEDFVDTPIAPAASPPLGGIPSITVAAVICTGILGAITAPLMARLFRVRDGIAKGVAIGTCSHAVGTTKALEMGELEGAMSGVSTAVSGLLTTAIVIVASCFL